MCLLQKSLVRTVHYLSIWKDSRHPVIASQNSGPSWFCVCLVCLCVCFCLVRPLYGEENSPVFCCIIILCLFSSCRNEILLSPAWESSRETPMWCHQACTVPLIQDHPLTAVSALHIYCTCSVILINMSNRSLLVDFLSRPPSSRMGMPLQDNTAGLEEEDSCFLLPICISKAKMWITLLLILSAAQEIVKNT